MTANNPKKVVALVQIRDGLTMVIDGINKLVEGKEPNEQPKYDLEKIKWDKQNGPKGPYEKASEQDSEDFRTLINDLEAHEGKLQRNGFFLWQFNTIGTNTVGRKKQSSR